MSATQSTQPSKAPNDPPHIRFPPFPTPPPGVKIIPFKQFKECGIQLFCADEEVELDGRNIPTVELRTVHDTDVCKTNAKRKRKKNKTPDPAIVVVPKEWWQTWEEGEDLRVYTYDSSLSRVDRLFAAATDFKNRPWPANALGLRGLWDQFQLYIGLLSNTRKTEGTKAPLDEDDSDDGSDEELEPQKKNTVGELSKTGNSLSRPEPDNDGEILDDISGEKDTLVAFINDPERVIKIFLSSHMRKHGLIWSDRNLVAIPHLVSFWLRFLLRNHALREASHERSLRRALEVAQLAMKELPLTSKIAKAVPDAFHEGCRECWGRKSDSFKTLSIPEPAADETERDSKRQRVEGAEGDDAGTVKAFEEELRAANVAVVPPSAGIDLAKEILDDNMDVDGAGWGTAPEVLDGSWGNAWGVEAGDIDTAAGDGDASGGANSWMSVWESPVRSLMPLLGPTALPITHTAGIVESSMRQIFSITKPIAGVSARSTLSPDPQAVEMELGKRFAKVVLAPWTGWENEEEAGFSEPRILESSRGAVVMPGGKTEVGAHDPYKDKITVLVEPSALPTFSIGMGIGGVWVQIVRQERDAEEHLGTNGQSAKKKKKGKSKETYWYIEELTMSFPSYYMS